MIRANQSTEFPPKIRFSDEVRNDINNLRRCGEIRNAYETLMEHYGDLLTDGEKGKAFMLNLGWQSVDIYESKFLSNILMQAYEVFDKKGAVTDQKYTDILNRIGVYNPEWVEAFVARHDMRVRIFEEARRKGKPFRPSQ